ncbi:MAG: glutathione S-transferase family protein [Deltaproteobacteria bacterium]|nr:glutathione S-transferase family protein [Deltaproteobacteria bacterium]
MSTENRIKLYDFSSSPNCQRVKVVLEEKKLPYETVPIDLKKGEQKKSDFLKLNPHGKVPVMIDGTAILYESCIINEYLEEKYPESPLMPRDPAKRARIRILIDFGISQLNPPYQKIRQELMKNEKERNQETIETSKKELQNLLQRLDREIGDRPFLAGELSLLDAALIPRFLRMEGMGVLPAPSLPKLGGWLQRMKDRPSVIVIM